MTGQTIAIIVLSLAVAVLGIIVVVQWVFTVDVAKRVLQAERTLSQFMKEDIRLHDTVKDRIDQIERKVNSKQPIDLPKYEKAMRDWHDRQTAETRAWDALADESMRTVEKD